MLFKNILDQKTAAIQPVFDKLLEDTFSNQTHPGDLLLIQVNGFYNSDTHKWTNIEPKLSPYMIGPNKEGHSEVLHHQFIGNYVKGAISQQIYADYQKLHEWSTERAKEIEELAKDEAYSVQMEMMLYLKIWEGDSFIKKFYQITQLNSGLPYDWHFSIAESSRDKDATGTRDKIIRKEIRDKLKDGYPSIYEMFNNSYKSQVRNSIAHSKYSIHGRYIHLNNAIENDPYSQIEVISFDEWVDIMHDTLVIYNQQTRLLNIINEFYSNLSKKFDLTMEVRINRKVTTISTEYHILKHRPEWGDWYWNANDEISKPESEDPSNIV